MSEKMSQLCNFQVIQNVVFVEVCGTHTVPGISALSCLQFSLVFWIFVGLQVLCVPGGSPCLLGVWCGVPDENSPLNSSH